MSAMTKPVASNSDLNDTESDEYRMIPVKTQTFAEYLLVKAKVEKEVGVSRITHDDMINILLEAKRSE